MGNAADRDAAVNIVMKRTGKSRAESEQIVDNWINTALGGWRATPPIVPAEGEVAVS